MTATRYVVVGGAGFIGGHAVDRLLDRPDVESVTVYDNFSSGRMWHLQHHLDDHRLRIVEADVKDLDPLVDAFAGHHTVIHLASNPDIARAAVEPDIDFWEGTFLTNQVVEAARRSHVETILYASGSGVYGDLGETEAVEVGPFDPVSTYGASKLAGEALIQSYCHMFGLRGRAFRFGNVVGPRQTHGVGFDFLRKLRENPNRLDILGDGRQSKSYVHVKDVLDAVFLAERACDGAFETFNVATGDYITVTEIAELAARSAGVDRDALELVYAGGDRGWKGDVPIVRLDTSKIRSLGWRNDLNSGQALESAMLSMMVDFENGLM